MNPKPPRPPQSEQPGNGPGKTHFRYRDPPPPDEPRSDVTIGGEDNDDALINPNDGSGTIRKKSD